MTLAIAEARKNDRYLFGAVIVRSGRVLARGFNSSREYPSHHAEVAAMGDHVRRAGSRGWAGSTAVLDREPCPMCMSACVRAGVGRIVWGTSFEQLRRTGLHQIVIPARCVADAAKSFYTPRLLLCGVLADTTDPLFRRAQDLRDGGSRSTS